MEILVFYSTCVAICDFNIECDVYDINMIAKQMVLIFKPFIINTLANPKKSPKIG